MELAPECPWWYRRRVEQTMPLRHRSLSLLGNDGLLLLSKQSRAKVKAETLEKQYQMDTGVCPSWAITTCPS